MAKQNLDTLRLLIEGMLVAAAEAEQAGDFDKVAKIMTNAAKAGAEYERLKRQGKVAANEQK